MDIKVAYGGESETQETPVLTNEPLVGKETPYKCGFRDSQRSDSRGSPGWEDVDKLAAFPVSLETPIHSH